MSQESSCDKCGQAFPANDRRCPACGAPQVDDDDFTLGVDDSWCASDAVDPHLEERTRSAAAESTHSQTSTAQSPAAPIREFGNYLIERKVAQGGMGVVYRARHKEQGRVVALKMIRSAELAEPEEVERFQVECQAAGDLDHPNIVTIYDYGECEGQHFYAMPFVDGKSLAAELLSGPLKPRDAAMLVALLAEAIHYAHSEGVIHRDLKPGNILLVEQPEGSRGSGTDRNPRSGNSSLTGRSSGATACPWQPRITDFGLAKSMEADSELTSTGQVLGTPSYMPPEQARGEEISPVVDVYALGATLYATLVGRPPFQAATAVETLRQVLEQDPVPPSRFSNISRDLDNICLKCLEKVPARRYQTAAELSDDLFAFLEGKPVKARPIGNVARFTRWCRRKPMAAAAMFAIGATLLTMFILVLVASELRYARERNKGYQTRVAHSEERAETERKFRLEKEFRGILSRVRERNAYREPGWAYQGLEDIEQALTLGVEPTQDVAVPDVLAACIVGLDARTCKEIPMPTGYRSHRVAMDVRHGRMAIATMKNRFQLKVIVCDCPSGENVRTLVAAPRSLTSFDGFRHVDFVDDGNVLVAVSRTGYLHRWDLREEADVLESAMIPFREDETIAVDPRRSRALICSEGKLFLWGDFESKEATPLFEGVDRVWDVSPDGQYAVIRRDGDLQVLDLESLEPIYDRPGSHKGWVDRRGRLIVHDDGRLLLFDLSSGDLLQTFQDPLALYVHDGQVAHVDASPDGTLLVSGGGDQKVSVWDVASGKLALSMFQGGDDQIFPMFASDRHIISTGDKRGVIIELNGRDTSGAVALHGRIDSFDISHAPERIVTGGLHPRGASVSVWDGSGCRKLETQCLAGSPLRPLVSTNDAATHVGVGTRDVRRIWSWTLPQETPSSDVADGGDDVVESVLQTTRATRPHVVDVDKFGNGWFIEDNDQIVRRSPDDLRELSRWSNRVASTLMGDGTVIALSAQGERVTALMVSGQLQVFSAADQEVIVTKQIRYGGSALSVSPEQNLAAYGTSDGELALVPLADQEPKFHDDTTHSDSILSLAFSPDGRLLACASGDRTISLWRVAGANADQVLVLRLDRAATQLRFDRRGDLLAALQNEVGLRVWRIGRLRQRFQEYGIDW